MAIFSNLTEQELRVLRLVSEHLTDREIASALGIAESTVETHMHHVLRKLSCGSRRQAARVYLRAGEAKDLDADAG